MNQARHDRRVKVCFVRPDAIRLFEPGAPGQIGGAQVRSFTFAKALAKRDGFDVSFVLHSDRIRPPEKFDGVAVHFCPTGPAGKAIRRQQQMRNGGSFISAAQSRLARKIRKRLGQLTPESINFYRNVGADIYCCFGVGQHSAEAIRASKQLGRKSVLFTVVDNELETPFKPAPTTSKRFHRKLIQCRNQAIGLSDEIVVQTEHQQRQLLERFGRQSSIIRNPIDMRPSAGIGTRPIETRYALWVGRAESFHKRADRLVALARLVPEIDFLAIVNRFPGDSLELLTTDQPDNLTIVEGVPFEQIERYFAAASAFVSTSDFEGFPNTFLQAAKYRVPILSYCVDPNQMLSKHGSGSFANGDLERLARLARRVWNGDCDLEVDRMGDAGHRYAETYHALDARVGELAQLLERLRPSHATWSRSA